MATQQRPSPQAQPPPPPPPTPPPPQPTPPLPPQPTPPPPQPTPPPPPPSPRDLAVALARPAGLWSSLVAHLPEVSRPHPHLVGSRRRRRRRTGLPLPIHRNRVDSARTGEMYNSFLILEDIIHYTLCTLHKIEENLNYWEKYTHQGTDLHMIYHMVIQRGPRHFIETMFQIVTRFRCNDSLLKYLKTAASDMVVAHCTTLTMTRRDISSFLAEVYFEVDEHREGLTESPDKSLQTLLVVLNTVFPKLEAAIGNTELKFERLPEVDAESPHWKGTSTDAILLIYQNLQKLEDIVSSLISSHIKPSNITMHWLPYTCGAIGLSACSLWLLRHSSLIGSPDISNWIQDAKESISGFWDRRVEKPIISIRDEVVRALDRSARYAATQQDVKLSEQSLRRMLYAFCEETSTEKLQSDMTIQDMLEIVMKRYEEQTKRPITNLFRGEIARAMLIQIQKLNLDLKEGMLELDQIIKANEINFAILAALPVLGLSLIMFLLVRAGIMRVNCGRSVWRSRIARRHRRALLNSIDRLVNEFEEDNVEPCKFGLAIYFMDRLYGMVEPVAMGTGEWARVSEDLIALSRSDLQKESKVAILAHLKEDYECLQMSPPID